MEEYNLVYITAEEDKKIDHALVADITALSGKVSNEKSWGKRTFSYPIKKKGAGFYSESTISIEPAQIKELRRELDLNPDILRYLLLKID